MLKFSHDIPKLTTESHKGTWPPASAQRTTRGCSYKRCTASLPLGLKELAGSDHTHTRSHALTFSSRTIVSGDLDRRLRNQNSFLNSVIRMSVIQHFVGSDPLFLYPPRATRSTSFTRTPLPLRRRFSRQSRIKHELRMLRSELQFFWGLPLEFDIAWNQWIYLCREDTELNEASKLLKRIYPPTSITQLATPKVYKH